MSNFASEFGIRLRNARINLGLTQEELAKPLHLKQGSIGHWENGRGLPDAEQINIICRILKITPDWLLGYTDKLNNAETSQGITWRIHEQAFLASSEVTVDFRRQIERGIEVFNLHVAKGLPLEKISHGNTKFAGQAENSLRHLLKVVLLSNTVEILDVEEDKEKGKILEEKFNLKRCFVAKTNPLFSSTIRNEIVAFLAAKQTLDLLPYSGKVGLTGGTTIARFVDLVPPVLPRLGGIKWLPLIATNDLVNESAASANSIIAKMLYKQPEAIGYFFPFIEPVNSIGHKNSDFTISDSHLDASSFIEEIKSVSIAFISVGSTQFEFQSSDAFLGLPKLKQIFDMMPDSEKEKCVGDILLQFVDAEGNRLGGEKVFTQIQKLVQSIGLDGLRNIVTRGGTVWILASRNKKAKTILGALNTKIANALVIDSSVANALLE